MHWGVFAISAAHLYQNYLDQEPPPPPPPPPNPCETRERMNVNDIDKKTITLKTVYILIHVSDVFFS